jgi:membrane protease YdiL (CAAX protease family)
LHDRYPVATFFALTLGISWVIWIPALVVLSGQVQLLAILPGGFGPLLAGAIMVRAGGGSLRAWVRDMAVWRVPARWYAVAFGFPLAVGAVVGAYAWTLGVEFDPALLPRRFAFYLGAVAFTMVLGGGQEEPGWRGYALPRLQARYGALAATLVVGVVWAGWHLPLFVFDSVLYADRPPAIYLAYVVALAVVFTWLYNSTRGSVLLAVVLHAGMNNATVLIPASEASLTATGIETTLFAVQTVALVAVAVALVAYYDADTLAPDKDLNAAITGETVGDVGAEPDN